LGISLAIWAKPGLALSKATLNRAENRLFIVEKLRWPATRQPAHKDDAPLTYRHLPEIVFRSEGQLAAASRRSVAHDAAQYGGASVGLCVGS
jgi:hypothetical protein